MFEFLKFWKKKPKISKTPRLRPTPIDLVAKPPLQAPPPRSSVEARLLQQHRTAAAPKSAPKKKAQHRSDDDDGVSFTPLFDRWRSSPSSIDNTPSSSPAPAPAFHSGGGGVFGGGGANGSWCNSGNDGNDGGCDGGGGDIRNMAVVAGLVHASGRRGKGRSFDIDIA